MAARWILYACRTASILRPGVEDRPRHAHQNLGHGRGRTPRFLVKPVERRKGGEQGDHVLGLLQRAARAKAILRREAGRQLAQALVRFPRVGQPAEEGRICGPMGHRSGDDGPEINLVRPAGDLRGLGHRRQHTGPRTEVVVDAQARDAGIVGSERQGLWAYYYVKPEALEELSAWLS